MAQPHVISALVKKRAELAGELAAHDRKRQAIMDRLAHVDSTLAIFEYGGDPRAIKPRCKITPRMFKRGHLRRMIADIGRQIPELKTNRLIAMVVISHMGWDKESAVLIAQVRDKVRDVRKVKRLGKDRGAVLWRPA